MEVVGHDLSPSAHDLDGRGVDLEEFFRTNGAIILLVKVRMDLGGPVDPAELRREGSVSCPIGAKSSTGYRVDRVSMSRHSLPSPEVALACIQELCQCRWQLGSR